MNEEIENKLQAEFPKLLRQMDLPASQTCMCWGFEYGDGWYDITRRMLEELQEADPECELLQAKEKWGELRVYVNGNGLAHEVVDKYEELSQGVCEHCGSTEEITSEGSWITTLCAKCRSKT